MHYTYIYRNSYFDLIVGSSSVNHSTIKNITRIEMFVNTRHIKFIQRGKQSTEYGQRCDFEPGHARDFPSPLTQRDVPSIRVTSS